MKNAKQRTRTHLIDSDGSSLLKHTLAQNNGQFVLREYHPDYGIDFAVEIFQPMQRRFANTETLGEHIFVQLKSKEKIQIKTIEVSTRKNVMIYAQEESRNDDKFLMQVIPIVIETSELITVERMGYGVPVLLVVADLEHEQCYFVCLNDYIDKILVPQYHNYASAKTRTVYVPLMNNLSSEHGIRALRWYGKRAKLLSAFLQFTFQLNELNHLLMYEQVRQQALFFAARNMRYDIWSIESVYPHLQVIGEQLRVFLETGVTSTLYAAAESNGDEEIDYLKAESVRKLWYQLVSMSNMYNAEWREWFLPTYLSLLLSAPSTCHVDDNV